MKKMAKPKIKSRNKKREDRRVTRVRGKAGNPGLTVEYLGCPTNHPISWIGKTPACLT